MLLSFQGKSHFIVFIIIIFCRKGCLYESGLLGQAHLHEWNDYFYVHIRFYFPFSMVMQIWTVARGGTVAMQHIL